MTTTVTELRQTTKPQFVSFEEIELTDQCLEDYQCYTTHDNGGMVFVVQVRKDNKQVNIYEAAFTKQDRKETSKYMIQQEIELDNGEKIIKKGIYCMDPIDKRAYFFALIKQINYDETPFEVYVGIDNTAEVFPRLAYPILFHGACMLLRFTPSNECWFFGILIAKFTIDENIQALYSPIGNSDVVYPYMMTDSKCYLFESGLSSIDKTTLANRPSGSDIYDFYYSNNSLFTTIPFDFESQRHIDKNYYRDPTVPLHTL